MVLFVGWKLLREVVSYKMMQKESASSFLSHILPRKVCHPLPARFRADDYLFFFWYQKAKSHQNPKLFTTTLFRRKDKSFGKCRK